MAPKAKNNPRQIRAKSCGCKLCTAKFRPDQKPTRKDCTGPWQARYRNPAGEQKAKNFPINKGGKKAAEAFLDSTRTNVRGGMYIDPNRGQVQLSEWYGKWRAGQRTEDTTQLREDSVWRNHVEPRFGAWKLADIGYLDVEVWVNDLTKTTGAGTIVKALQILDRLLSAAVRDRRLPFNPCDGVKAPKPKAKHPEDLKPPTYEQLAAVRGHVPEHYRPMLVVFEETGLRWGELTGLRRCWVDLEAGQLQVREVVVQVGAKLQRKSYPKSSAGFRTVPLTPVAVEAFREHLERHPADGKRSVIEDGMCKEEVVFRGPRGSVLMKGHFHGNWTQATQAAGIARKVWDPVIKRHAWWPHVHDIRHAFASRLHEAGVPEAVVQEIMGHERGGKITWLYTHAGSDAVEQARAALTGGRALRVVS